MIVSKEIKRQREQERKRTRGCESENEKKSDRKMDDKEANTRLKLFVRKSAKSKKYFKLFVNVKLGSCFLL